MTKALDLYLIERMYHQRGFAQICGIDEAGRGPLAGPVCAASVVLDPDKPIEGLNDSKKLSAKRREALYPEIIAKALAFGVGWASCEEIDEHNILQATFLAMGRAVQAMELVPDLALVDGNRDPKLGIETQCIIQGDGQCAAIAAASILAKVSRDRVMAQLEEQYPGYGLGTHMGYPTAAHRQAILQLGPCPAHRRSFLKKLLGP